VNGWSPLGVRTNADNMLLTDVTNGKHRVMQLSKDGNVTFEFGHEGKGNTADELWFPNSMVVDAHSRMYISDSNNARIQVLDQNGTWLETLHGFSLPRGMTIDEDQRLYIVDGIGQLVRVFDVSGENPVPLFDFGDYGAGDGEFNYPNDIASDTTSRLYIADRASNRLQVWAY
jgi:tripartite motif-containing protein 71